MLKVLSKKVGMERTYDSFENRIRIAVRTDYPVKSYVMLFFAYSFIGWLWEVLLFLVLQQEFVNTGLLHGPWLPIYGVGGIGALELFKNIRTDPLKTFYSIMVVAGVLEYATHAATEIMWGVTWWDYSDYMLNINGRICIEGLLAFGILGCIAIYIISPKIKDRFMKINNVFQNSILTIFTVLFIIDAIYSFISPNQQNIYS